MNYRERILYAHAMGYRVTDEGALLTPQGEPRTAYWSGSGYPNFGFWVREIQKMRTIEVHRLAAYCFFGESAFTPGIQVRHLNGNRLDFSRKNIALGTPDENRNDTPAGVRKSAAVQANQARWEPSNHLTPEQIDQIRTEYWEARGDLPRLPDGVGLRLREKWGLSPARLSMMVRGLSHLGFRKSRLESMGIKLDREALRNDLIELEKTRGIRVRRGGLAKLAEKHGVSLTFLCNFRNQEGIGDFE